MIIDNIKRAELPNHNLGSVVPPSLISTKLKDFKKDLELIWDSDDSRWHVYQVRQGVVPAEDLLIYQVSLPYQGTNISNTLISWLQSKDYSEGGKLDQEQREKKWVQQFRRVQTDDIKRRNKQKAENSYRLADICDYLKRVAFGGARVAIPGMVVGVNKKTGKPIRAYKKRPKIGIK